MNAFPSSANKRAYASISEWLVTLVLLVILAVIAYLEFRSLTYTGNWLAPAASAEARSLIS